MIAVQKMEDYSGWLAEKEAHIDELIKTYARNPRPGVAKAIIAEIGFHDDVYESVYGTRPRGRWERAIADLPRKAKRIMGEIYGL